MLRSLRIRNLRIVSEADLELASGLTLISGRNGMGKTTILEAIHLLATGRTLRAGRESEAIQQGQDEGGAFGVADDATQFEVRLVTGGRKRALINGNGLRRTADLLGRLPTVAFAAQDLSLVTGDPAARRLYLDQELSQILPSYLKNLTVYKRALTQRNAALKAVFDGLPEDALEPYEIQMAASGAELRRERIRWVTELAPGVAAAHARLSGGEQLGLTYAPKDDFDDAESGLRAYRDARRKDLQRGTTTVGPHRDDMVVQVAGRDARLHGSQGQQRTAVIAIKMASRALMEERIGRRPILLLDDVFSDLDETRRAQLAAWALEPAGQVILTCTEPGQAGAEVAESARILHVESGVVRA